MNFNSAPKARNKGAKVWQAPFSLLFFFFISFRENRAPPRGRLESWARNHWKWTFGIQLFSQSRARNSEKSRNSAADESRGERREERGDISSPLIEPPSRPIFFPTSLLYDTPRSLQRRKKLQER